MKKKILNTLRKVSNFIVNVFLVYFIIMLAAMIFGGGNDKK